MANTEKLQLNKAFFTEESIHALILVAGMIVISRNFAGSSWEGLLTIVATIMVYFLGHIYASIVALMAEEDNAYTVKESIVITFKRSWRMIMVAFLPLIFLALGAMSTLESNHAIWIALTVDALILAAIGWVITRKKTQKFWLRVGGSAITASFGIFLIALKGIFYR